MHHKAVAIPERSMRESARFDHSGFYKTDGGSEFAVPVQRGREHAFGLIVQALALGVPFAIVGPVFCNAKNHEGGDCGMGGGCGCRGWRWEQRRDVTEPSLNSTIPKSAGQSGGRSGLDISHKRDFLISDHSADSKDFGD